MTRIFSGFKTLGERSAAKIYFRFVQGYSIQVARLDPDIFDHIEGQGAQALEEALAAYKAETEEPFPREKSVQLSEVLRSMARAWEGTTARLLRQAKGAPVDAGLGLIVQKMAFGVGRGECGAGVLQLVNSETGMAQITGDIAAKANGVMPWRMVRERFIARDERGVSLKKFAQKFFTRSKSMQN